MRKKTVDMISVLSDDIKAVLYSFSKSHSLPASLAKRSKIILLASQERSNQTIASQVDLHYNHVATWRNRFPAALPSLRKIEADTPEKLEEKILLLLSDRKRSGTPPVFTQEQIAAIIALACQNPSDFGYEVSLWSLSLLTVEIKKPGIVDQILEKSVSRFFNEVNLQPHRIRYWLHSSEKE